MYSRLEVVNLVAMITSRLVERGISTNDVSELFHDYLFSLAERAEVAMRELEEISVEAKGDDLGQWG